LARSPNRPASTDHWRGWGETFSIKMIGVGWGTVKAMSYPAQIFMARRVTVL
jgi:hypothetical protein